MRGSGDVGVGAKALASERERMRGGGTVGLGAGR